MATRIKNLALGMRMYASDVIDPVLIFHRRNTEIKKMKDPRRIKIQESVILSETQKKEIDDFYLSNYGEKIPYTWHQHYMAYTGKFDVKYFPELLYIPEFEYFMNQKSDYQRVFADKNVTPMIAKSVGIKTPYVFLSCVAGVFRYCDGTLISLKEAIDKLGDIGEAFIKPTVDSCSGNGCAVIDIKNGIDQISGKKLAELFAMMGKNFVVQERIKTHKSISSLYANSVNTFRIMTYFWKGSIEHVPIIMRIGQGGSVLDNAHAGGMFIAVTDDGVLHSTAFTEFNQTFTEHPDTHVIYEGHRIELAPEVLKAAKKMHSAIPQVGVVNWDFTLDESGMPLLIEANIFGGGIWVFEMAHGCGAFGDKTGEILQWLRKQKEMRKSKRHDRNSYGWIG